MAKKTKRAAGKKTSEKRHSKANGSAAPRRRTITAKVRRRPKDTPLPGMEDVRISALNDVAGRIADIREQKNDLIATENEELQTALNLMRKHEKVSWRAHGVEFVRVPGEEKLRVRTSKEKATAEVEEETQAEHP